MMRIRLRRDSIKRAIIISLPVVFALTAAVSIALLVRPRDGQKNDVPDENNVVQGGEDEKKDVEVIAPVETPPKDQSEGLRFRSKGNGTCAVVGIGECADRIVSIPSKSPDGETVVEISVGAFADLENIVEIIIPDSVVSIGSGAFSSCKSLEAITVGEANPLFSSENGVLFNKAKSTLLCYPSGKKDRVYVLPGSVLRIGAGAFSSCPALVELEFIGTRAEWQAIYVAEGNPGLKGVKIVCASADK